MYLVIVLEAQSINRSYLFKKKSDRDTKAIELAKEYFLEEDIQFDTLQDIVDFQDSSRFYDQCYDSRILTEDFYNID